MTIHDTIAHLNKMMDEAQKYVDRDPSVRRIDFATRNPCDEYVIECVAAMPELLAHIQRLEAVALAARIVSSQRNGPYLMSDMETTQHAEAELKQALAALDKEDSHA